MTVATSRFFDTGVDHPRFSFDGSDPSTGHARASGEDLVLAGDLLDPASIRVEFEGSDGEPFDPTVEDPATRTGFGADVRTLDGRRHVRFRITFTAGAGGEGGAQPPGVERLAIRFAYY